MQAKSVLLEPWYDFVLTVPTEVIGRAITDVRAMSGEFDAPENFGELSELKGILPEAERELTTDVLNGIAYDATTGRIFITGKKWPKIYEIELIKQ